VPYVTFASSPVTRRRMQALAAGRDTAAELALRRELTRRGLRGYRIDRDLGLPGVRRRSDVAWIGRRVAVFVDGCFWHSCPEHGTTPATNAGYWTSKLARNVARDRETDRIATEHGWTVVRIWEHQHPSTAVDIVEEAFTRR
jgi:DNA mismatch endonuclease (patch repair protein)